MRNPFAFGKDLWDPTHRFETSWLIPPWLLFGLRLVFGLYCWATQIANLVDRKSLAGQEFSYFTTLTYWGLAFYFLVSAAHTGSYAFRKNHRPFLASFPRPLQALHSLFYTTIVVFPIIVTLVYWAILYPDIKKLGGYKNTFALWSNVSRHAMNTGFTAFEVFVPRTAPMPWTHIPFLIIMLAGYLGVAYITYNQQGYYTYGFLNPDNGKGKLAGYIVGIALGSAVLFVIIWCVVWARRWLTEERLGMRGKFVRRPDGTLADGSSERGREVELAERGIKGSEGWRGSSE